jgi:hypothetical protein
MKPTTASLLLVSTIIQPCAAAVITWDGDSPAGTSWFANASGDTNWAGDALPATGDDVVINSAVSGGSWVSSLLAPVNVASVTVGDIYVEPDLSQLTVSAVTGMNVGNGVVAAGSAGYRGEIFLTDADATWGFLDVGIATGTIGRVDVTASSDLTVEADTSLGRNGGDGTLKIMDSTYRPHAVFVGDGAGSSGTLEIEASTLIVTNRFEVGENGNGSFPMNGGSITALNMLFGVFDGSLGSGAIYATAVNLTGQLRVGVEGDADVTIGDNSNFNITTPGGLASITVGESALSAQCRLRIEVNGDAGTLVTTNQHAVIGINSAAALLEIVNGTLTTAKGDSPTGSSCIFGLNAGSVGTGSIENGSLIGNGATVVGFNGTGNLSLIGGQVDCDKLQVARMSGSTGSVIVSNSGIITLDTDATIGGGPAGAGGTATVNINSSGQLHATTAIILHSGGVLDVVDAIDTPGFAVTGATAFPEPAPVNGAVNVRTGGTLSGNGKITGNLDARGGLVSPGLSAGRLWVTGNGEMTTGSTLRIEIGGLTPVTQHDVLKLDGTFNYSGLAIEVLTPSFSPSSGQTFKIIDAAAYAGASFTFSGPALTPGLSWDTSTLLSDGILRVTGTPTGEVRIVSITRSGNDMILGIIGDPGTPYVIQAGTTLGIGSWSDLPGSYNANGALQNQSITNTLVDFPSKRFFRLKSE